MAAEAFRADGELDASVGEDVLRLELESAGERDEREDGVVRHVRLNTDSGEAAMGGALPAWGGQRRLLRAVPRAEPEDRVVQLENLFDGASRALQMAIPVVEGMVVASRVEILVAPVDSEINFHGDCYGDESGDLSRFQTRWCRTLRWSMILLELFRKFIVGVVVLTPRAAFKDGSRFKMKLHLGAEADGASRP